MQGLMLHTGGYNVKYEDLKGCPIPKSTNTYAPIPHHAVVDSIVETIVGSGFDVLDIEVGLKDKKAASGHIVGAKLFGQVTFGPEGADIEEGSNLVSTIGFRSSYDKSMAMGFVGGSSVFVCDNMMLTGDITSIRRHTPKAMDDIFEILFRMVHGMGIQSQLDKSLRKKFINTEISTNEGLKILGYFAANQQLSYIGGTASPFALAIHEWTEPTFEDFHGRDAWSLYNACTYGLKKVPMDIGLESNTDITKEFIKLYTPDMVQEYVEIAI